MKIFRVDNPHTKPVRVLDEVIDDVGAPTRTSSGSEAFTAGLPMMHAGQGRLPQSATYFHLAQPRNEFTEHGQHRPAADCTRPSFWPTPRHPARPPQVRRVRWHGRSGARGDDAGTSWGVPGYEFFESRGASEGAEEYLTPRKLSTGRATSRPRRLRTVSLAVPAPPERDPRRHPALQQLRIDVPPRRGRQLLVSKDRRRRRSSSSRTLDPFANHETQIHPDMPALGMEWARPLPGPRRRHRTPIRIGASTTSSD